MAIYVPPSSVGAIIGRGGRTILNIQREASKRSYGHAGPVRINVLGGNNNNNYNNCSFGGGGGGGNNSGGNNGGDALLFGTAAAAPATDGGGATAWNYQGYPPDNNVNNENDNYQDDDGSNCQYDDADDSNWTPVIIRGDPVGAFAAVRQILPLLVAENNTYNINNNNSAGNDALCIHDGIVLDVPIHWSKHNLLVGRGGLTVAALSATYQTRIMIPPPPPSEGNANRTKQQLAVNGGGGGSSSSLGGASSASSMPTNIVQLEGDDIDMVEQCLAKMLGIVAGEDRWVPTGRRITVDEKKGDAVANIADVAIIEEDEDDEKKITTGTYNSVNNKSGSDVPIISNDHGNIIMNPAAVNISGTKKDEDTPTTIAETAEAVIVKVWTPSSKLLNMGKIRKIQRKTNTIIRRKKLSFVDGVTGGNVAGLDSGNKVVNNYEKEEEAEEPDDDVDDTEEEDGGGVAGGNLKGIASGKRERERESKS